MKNKFYSLVTTHRNKIIDIGYDENGNKSIKKINFEPIIGFESNKDSKYKNIYQQNLEVKKFKNINSWKEYIKENNELISIYGNIAPEYQYINQNYKNIDFHYNFMKVFFFDIEVVSLDGHFPYPNIADVPVNTIAIKDKHKKIFYSLSLKPYNKTKNIIGVDPKIIKFKHCKSEEDLLITFIKILKHECPDILVGWFSNNFDIPYIINRCYNILSDETVKEMSMFHQVYTNENEINGRKIYHSKIGGIILLDYLELYKMYTYTTRSSYSLEHISNIELKDGKLNFDNYDNFREFWEHEPQKFMDYNIYDVELIDLLDEHLGLIDLHCSIAYKARCNLQDAIGTVKLWDILIYHFLIDQNIMIPPMVSKEFESFAGAYVKEPVKKIYDWTVSIDLRSLYPHLIQQYQISPENLINDKIIPGLLNSKKLDDRFLNQEFSVDPRAILAANGQYFKKNNNGFLPKIMHAIYSERKEIKKDMLTEKQKFVNLKIEMQKRGLEI